MTDRTDPSSDRSALWGALCALRLLAVRWNASAIRDDMAACRRDAMLCNVRDMGEESADGFLPEQIQAYWGEADRKRAARLALQRNGRSAQWMGDDTVR